MGKAERNRQQNARQRIALQQAAARRAETQRRAYIAGGSILLVIVIVVGLVVAKSLGGSSTPTASKTSTTAKVETTVATQLTTVPQAVLDKVGAGGTGVAPLKSITSAALTSDNKPEMLYIGAEYCPYCAAERWAMAIALSRFGTLSNLHFIHSTSSDIYASTPTLTFYQSSYTSKYLSFVPLETETVSEKALQKPTAAESALIAKYGSNSFPFVDIDGKYIVSGAQYLPSVLGSSASTGVVSKSILTWQQIGNDLQDPSSPVGQAIVGSANHIIAAICQVTHNQPSNVCSAPNVTAVSGDI